MYSADEVHIIQTVSSCLTSTHRECSGYYKDQSDSVLVRCTCKCHELVAINDNSSSTSSYYDNSRMEEVQKT
jgi:hypothetical protein